MSDWKFASDASGWTLAKWIFATLGSAEDTPLDGGPLGGGMMSHLITSGFWSQICLRSVAQREKERSPQRRGPFSKYKTKI